jgi:hypothetical protein
MINALFWYIGLVVWLIPFGVISMLLVDAHDRSVMTRREHLNRR